MDANRGDLKMNKNKIIVIESKENMKTQFNISIKFISFPCERNIIDHVCLVRNGTTTTIVSIIEMGS
jgi:IMP cyclohydrolase